MHLIPGSICRYYLLGFSETREVLRVMDSLLVKRKRRRLTISLALLGLLISAVFFAYFETDPRPESQAMLWAAGLSLVLCPGSLLFVTWFDVEPQTSAFAVVWLVIGMINVAFYGGIGVVLGQYRWKEDRKLPGNA
jgi:hypothetical protein